MRLDLAFTGEPRPINDITQLGAVKTAPVVLRSRRLLSAIAISTAAHLCLLQWPLEREPRSLGAQEVRLNQSALNVSFTQSLPIVAGDQTWATEADGAIGAAPNFRIPAAPQASLETVTPADEEAGEGALGQNNVDVPESDFVEPIRSLAEVDVAPRLRSEIDLDAPELRNFQRSTPVLLSLLIGASGRVEHIEVHSEKPTAVFELVAFRRFRHAEFYPAMIGGRPVPVRMTIEVFFINPQRTAQVK